MNIEDRMARIEAELAIRNVIARYGLAADCGDIATALACHIKDAVYVVSNPRAGREGEAGNLELKGHHAIADMLSSDMHQSLLPDCAHTVGPLVVEVTGETATALGYSRVYHKQKLMRLAVNSWTMRKTDSTWKIARRESRVVGEEAAQKLLRESLNGV
jgi:ketosteroid isomerase-like protein